MEHFSGGTHGKQSVCQCRRHKRLRFDPWVRKIPWSRKWQPTPVFWPGEFHGQRSLSDDSPHGCKELYTTEHMSTHEELTKGRARGKLRTDGISLQNISGCVFAELFSP